MSVFDGAREDWETDLEWRVSDISGDRIVIDELVIPSVDPHTQPPSVLRELTLILWPALLCLAYAVGVAMAYAN